MQQGLACALLSRRACRNVTSIDRACAYAEVAERRIEPSASDLSIELETDYGIQVNALGVDELFALYERAGFLYPAKAARLTAASGRRAGQLAPPAPGRRFAALCADGGR